MLYKHIHTDVMEASGLSLLLNMIASRLTNMANAALQRMSIIEQEKSINAAVDHNFFLKNEVYMQSIQKIHGW